MGVGIVHHCITCHCHVSSVAWLQPSVVVTFTQDNKIEAVRQRIRLMLDILILDHNCRPPESRLPLNQTPQPATAAVSLNRLVLGSHVSPSAFIRGKPRWGRPYPSQVEVRNILPLGVRGATRARAAVTAVANSVSAHDDGGLGWWWVDGCKCCFCC